jgi:O-antigen ligase
MNQIFGNPRQTMMVAIGWSVFDIVLHIVVDSVEWQRVSGNLAVIAAGLASQSIASGRTNAGLAAAAAVATVVLNVMWMVSEGAAPIIAVILIAVALALLLVAGRQFFADSESSSVCN